MCQVTTCGIKDGPSARTPAIMPRPVSYTLIGVLAIALAFSSAAMWKRWLGPLTLGAGARRCTPPPADAGPDLVALEPMFDDRHFEKPVQLVQHPREDATWFVVLHSGIVLRVRDGDSREVLDLTERILFGEQWGLQQIALHPRFPEDPRVFVTYFAPGTISVVAVVETALDGRETRPTKVTTLLAEQQIGEYHPVGGLVFGPDGYLYVGWGEGGLLEPDPTALRSKLLRIDVDRRDRERAYAIPADNPFVGRGRRPEIYASGLRNPWRFSFDSLTGALWLGDVGDAGYEEINRIGPGKDFGWPVWEGSECRRSDLCAASPTEPPVFQHGHAEVCAVIGGYVYRGRLLDGIRGKYVYGDGCEGTLYALDVDATPPETIQIARPDFGMASMAEDRDGELYTIAAFADDAEWKRDYSLGRVYKLVPDPDPLPPGRSAPARVSLAEIGCAAAGGTGHYRADNLVEYALNVPAWEDGAEIRRFMTTAPSPTRPGQEDALAPPTASVVLKTYTENGRPVRTQMLARLSGGRWHAYLYEWNDDGTDAWPIEGADTQCSRCHNPRTGTLRALSVSQLNRDFHGADQIARLLQLGVLERPTPEASSSQAFPRIDDEGASIEERARVYLDVNCASCHQPGGTSGAARFDLRRTTPLALAGLCDATPQVALVDHNDARVIAPGRPEASVLSIRMHAFDLSAMPPGRRSVDPDGTSVVDAWITSLDACSPPSR
jgi:glucose/arabinose dehydrogenase